MANAEQYLNGDAFDKEEFDGNKERPVVVSVSMLPEEAEIRKKAASRVEGVQFNSYTNEEFKQTFGIDPGLRDWRRVIGRTEADDWKTIDEYAEVVERLLLPNKTIMWGRMY